MHLVINNKGITLIESLVVTAILGVSSFGLLKASQQTVLTSKEINLYKDTEDFKNSVYTILNLYCKKNLNPGVLTPDPSSHFDRVDQLMALNDALFRVRTNNLTQRPIKNNFKNIIEIVDMKLTTAQHKTFYLYYKYNFPSLGAQQTRTSDPCTNTNVKGCYYLSCKLDYECTGGTCSKCEPLDCGVVKTHIDEVNCELGQVLVGVTGSKKDDCKPGCPPGQFLVGIKENAQREKVAECAKELDCGEGEVAVESEPDSSGIHIMKCKKMACPEDTNQHVVLLENGETVCKKTCHGGQRLNSNNQCVCPHGEPDQYGNCTCPPSKTENPESGACECPYGQVDDGNNGCECGPHRWKHHGNCICSLSDLRVDDGNGNCVCQEGSLEVNSTCKCKSGQKDYNQNKCICKEGQCPSIDHCVCSSNGKYPSGHTRYPGRCMSHDNRDTPEITLLDPSKPPLEPCPEE